MTTQQPAPSAQARLVLQKAFERFAKIVSPDDRREFSDTKLQDVREGALQIERQLRARRTQRNMVRLEPFLQGMERYSKVMEILCNGTPFLSWAWAPVRLVLLITIDSLNAFEKLVEAYGRIADLLPCLDRLSAAFSYDLNFQNVLALVYSDILEIHYHAYKYVHKKSWAITFSSLWARFETRFDSILQRLAYHSDLLDKEAFTINMSEAVRHNQEEAARWEQQESEWEAYKLRDVLTWLRINESSPEQTFEKHCRDSLPDSCDWFLQQDKIQLWQNHGIKNALVWITGKPGAGKSVLCSNVVRSLQANGLDVLYYFCSYLGEPSGSCSSLLRSLACQIIQKRNDLAIYVYDSYFVSHPKPDTKAMIELLPILLQEMTLTRIVIDGVDEWNGHDQRELLKHLEKLICTDQSRYICKVLVSSRDTLEISRSISRKNKAIAFSHLSDGYESDAINHSISRFVEARLKDLPSHFSHMDPGGLIVPLIEKKLLEKSDGMFLWVRLVLDSFRYIYSPEDLNSIVDDLPSDLDSLYARIFDRLCSVDGPQRYGGVPRIISWICHAQRPLYQHELVHAISIASIASSDRQKSVPVVQILDHCKPLIEIRSDGTVVFVHLSVKEFFLACKAPQIVPFPQAQLDLASASVATLVKGLGLLEPTLGHTDVLVQIASGAYRLLEYALEFWIEHCLLYVTRVEPSAVQGLLLDRLSQLHGKHDLLARTLHREIRQLDTSILSPDAGNDVRLQAYANSPAQIIMRDVLQVRRSMGQQNCENGKDAENFMEQRDPTLFSRLTINLEQAVVYLLSHRTVDGIPAPKLFAFQESYASSAFRCRFPYCQYASAGFASEQLRSEHETSHFRRVYCKVESCRYSRIGFNTKAARDRHNQKTHEEALSIAVPPKIRRVAKVGAFRLSLRTKDQKVDPAPYLDSRQVTRLNSPQAQHQLYLAQSNVLADLDPDQLPASHKREGQDWYAVFNPRARRVLDVDLMHTLPHQSVVCCVRFSLDGRYVATGSNRVALVHDVETGDLVASLDHFAGLDEGGDMYIRSVCFSSDGRYLATGNEDKTVCVWDLAINKIMHTFTGHEEDVYNLEFARNGRFIASGSGDRTVRLWDLESNSQVARFTGEDAITSVSISPDSLYVAAGSLDKSVRVWDVQDGRIVARFEGEEGHKNSVYSVAFVPSGDRLISASLDKTIKMWELPTSTHPGKCVRTFEGHKDFALNVTMTPRGDWMLSGSKDRSTMLWDPHTGVAQFMLIGHKNSVIAVASSPTNGVFATASGDKRARIWKYDRYIGP